MNTYCVIIFTNSKWERQSSLTFNSVELARISEKEVASWSNDKRPTNVIGTCWLDCLDVWPTPEEQEEATLLRLSRQDQRNQETSLDQAEALKSGCTLPQTA